MDGEDGFAWSIAKFVKSLSFPLSLSLYLA
jgi:hypothetical protein